MYVIKKISGISCRHYVKYFDHVCNIDITDLSSVYLKDYIYDSVTYDMQLKLFFDNLYKIKDSFNLSACCLYLVLKFNSTLDLKKFKIKYKNPVNDFKIRELEVSEFTVDSSTVVLIKVPLNSKFEIYNCFEHLYSSYAPISFIGDDIKLTDIIFSNFISIKSNTKGSYDEIIFDFRKMKESFKDMLFTYGGFDFGQFILGKF